MRRCYSIALGILWLSQATATAKTLNLSCAVAYMPQRQTWVRDVQIDWDRQVLRSVRIDGLTPHGFSVHSQRLSTAMDNERIQIDLAQAKWLSDFRGLASGQGRCEKVGP